MFLVRRHRNIAQNQRHKMPGMQGRGDNFFNRIGRGVRLLSRPGRFSTPDKSYLHSLWRQGCG